MLRSDDWAGAGRAIGQLCRLFPESKPRHCTKRCAASRDASPATPDTRGRARHRTGCATAGAAFGGRSWTRIGKSPTRHMSARKRRSAPVATYDDVEPGPPCREARQQPQPYHGARKASMRGRGSCRCRRRSSHDECGGVSGARRTIQRRQDRVRKRREGHRVHTQGVSALSCAKRSTGRNDFCDARGLGADGRITACGAADRREPRRARSRGVPRRGATGTIQNSRDDGESNRDVRSHAIACASLLQARCIQSEQHCARSRGNHE
jgi:hypothetical protein